MSVTESGKIEGILDELRNWPSSERLRLARMILETLEAHRESVPQRQGSLKDLLGVLKTTRRRRPTRNARPSLKRNSSRST